MQVIFVYGGGNDLGRAYCLWLIANHLDWTTSTYAANPIWKPLQGTGFAALPLDKLDAEKLGAADAVIIYQPLPDTLGKILPLAMSVGTAVLVDIDDPHWEGRYGFTALQQARVALGMLRRGRSPLPAHRTRRAARALHTITASPFVQDRSRGTLIPHVRLRTAKTDFTINGGLRIAFVGTPRPYKGLDHLRDAASEVEGVELFITAPAPQDSRSNEHWVGTTSLPEGRDLLAQCHLAAVLQSESPWTRRQFPVKVVDAMMAGRVVLGTDLPPIRWAVGRSGILVPPGDQDALVRAITKARDNRDQLATLGAKARSAAGERFTPESVAPAFETAVTDAISGKIPS